MPELSADHAIALLEKHIENRIPSMRVPSLKSISLWTLEQQNLKTEGCGLFQVQDDELKAELSSNTLAMLETEDLAYLLRRKIAPDTREKLQMRSIYQEFQEKADDLFVLDCLRLYTISDVSLRYLSNDELLILKDKLVEVIPRMEARAKCESVTIPSTLLSKIREHKAFENTTDNEITLRFNYFKARMVLRVTERIENNRSAGFARVLRLNHNRPHEV
jgi:hypothetical protein